MSDKPDYNLESAKGHIKIGSMNIYNTEEARQAARENKNFRERIDKANSYPFARVGSMRVGLAKTFGVLFGILTAFFLCYFIWSAFFAEATIYQMIGRGADLAVMAYITYSIHSEIRSRVRYDRDRELYSQVRGMMRSTPVDAKRELP